MVGKKIKLNDNEINITLLLKPGVIALGHKFTIYSGNVYEMEAITK